MTNRKDVLLKAAYDLLKEDESVFHHVGIAPCKPAVISMLSFRRDL